MTQVVSEPHARNCPTYRLNSSAQTKNFQSISQSGLTAELRSCPWREARWRTLYEWVADAYCVRKRVISVLSFKSDFTHDVFNAWFNDDHSSVRCDHRNWTWPAFWYYEGDYLRSIGGGEVQDGPGFGVRGLWCWSWRQEAHTHGAMPLIIYTIVVKLKRSKGKLRSLLA